MIKQEVYVAGVKTLVPREELTPKVIGIDEDGRDIYGRYYTYYNSDGTPDLVAEQKATDTKTLQDLETQYELDVSNLTKGYPKTEKDTWFKQETEARAYMLDTNADVPFMTKLAEARNTTKFDMATKIIENSDVYANAVGALTGKYQQDKKDLGA